MTFLILCVTFFLQEEWVFEKNQDGQGKKEEIINSLAEQINPYDMIEYLEW